VWNYKGVVNLIAWLCAGGCLAVRDSNIHYYCDLVLLSLSVSCY